MTEKEVKRVAEKVFAYTTLALVGIHGFRDDITPAFGWSRWETHWDVFVLVPGERESRTLRVPNSSYGFLFEADLKKAIAELAKQVQASLP